MVYYYIPQDGDVPDPPNAFIIKKPTRLLTLLDIQSHFPLSGNYHFRFLSRHGGRVAWFDLDSNSSRPPASEGNAIMMKVTRMTWVAKPPHKDSDGLTWDQILPDESAPAATEEPSLQLPVSFIRASASVLSLSKQPEREAGFKTGSTREEVEQPIPLLPAAKATAEICRKDGPLLHASVTPLSWEGLVPLKETLSRGIAKCHLDAPLPVQQSVLSAVLLRQSDVIVESPPESGKTVALCIIVLQLIDPAEDSLQGLIVTPTRGMAKKVLQALADLAIYNKIVSYACVDEIAYLCDIKMMKRKPQVLVATPENVTELAHKGLVSLKNVRVFAADEADELLTKWFNERLREIADYFAPAHVRMCAFSGGELTTKMLDTAKALMTVPEIIKLTDEEAGLTKKMREYVRVPEDQKAHEPEIKAETEPKPLPPEEKGADAGGGDDPLLYRIPH